MWHIEIAGAAAWAALVDASAHAPCRATVIAVFDRSCYVETPAGTLVCVGSPAIGFGPLNAIIAGFLPPRPGDSVLLSLAGARLWRAAFPGSDCPRADCPWGNFGPSGLRRLQLAASEFVSTEGLGGLLYGTTSILIQHAQPGIQALQRWLKNAGNRDNAGDSGCADAVLTPVFGLLGLGPGLTPSGDDYLCGTLIALHLVGKAPLAQHLWQELSPQLAARTNRVSAAHMAAAANHGEGHAALHQCLHAMCDGTAPDSALKALSQVGHSSGWDALVGAVAALQAVGQPQPLN